jgi:drug/metabolite transporter (DMT)-like permease
VLILISGALAYLTGITAVTHLGSLIALSEFLFAALGAWLLPSQAPTAMQTVGGLLIITGLALARRTWAATP